MTLNDRLALIVADRSQIEDAIGVGLGAPPAIYADLGRRIANLAEQVERVMN